jgi:hypothetical protein
VCPITAPSYDYGTAGVGAGALGSPANTVPLTDQQLDIAVTGIDAEITKRVAMRYTGKQRDALMARAMELRVDFRYALKQAGLAEPINEFEPNRTTATIR